MCEGFNMNLRQIREMNVPQKNLEELIEKKIIIP